MCEWTWNYLPDVGHLLVNPLPLLLLVLTVSDVTDELREPTHRHLEGSLLEGNEKKEKPRDPQGPGLFIERPRPSSVVDCFQTNGNDFKFARK